MTAEDIIAANPDLAFRPATIRRQKGLIGKTKDGGERFVVWLGDVQVACSLPIQAGSIGIMVSNLRDAQPGKEFKTVGADKYARIFREAGFAVIADANGDPCPQFKGARA